MRYISGGINKDPFINEAESKCKKYGIHYQIFKTTGTDDEKHLEEVLSRFRPDKVASVGGDGTTLFTAIAVMKKDIPMGIIPLGSANGMATEFAMREGRSDARTFCESRTIESTGRSHHVGSICWARHACG